MRKVTPFLWFDDDLGDALQYYDGVLPGVRLLDESRAGGPDAPLFSARFSITDLEFAADETAAM